MLVLSVALASSVALTGLSGAPIRRQAAVPQAAGPSRDYAFQRAEPAQDHDDCSPKRRQKEKEAFSRAYWIGRDGDNGIVLLPYTDVNRKFVLDIYQQQADAYNWYDGELECHVGPADRRWLTTSCNIVITPCQKAALKEAANENKKLQ